MIRLPILLVFAPIFSGCGKQMDGPVERSWGRMAGLAEFVGNMDDISCAQGRTQDPRRSAADSLVHMADFEGRFVWTEYAAS